MRNSKTLSTMFIIIAATLWGTIGLFVRKVNLFGIQSMDIVFFRCAGAFVILFPILLIFKRKELCIKWKDLWCFIGSGIVSITFFNFCYFTTIARTSLSIAAILLYTSPAFVILLSAIIFKEKITIQKICALILAFCGCLCVSGIAGGNNALTPLNLLIGIGAGVGYALYSIFGRLCINRGYSSLTISVYSFLFSAIGTLPFINLKKVTTIVVAQSECWPPILALIILTTLLAYLFYTTGLLQIENGKASIIACVEPLVATLIGICIFHEALTISNTIGILLILGATILVNYSTKNINATQIQ